MKDVIIGSKTFTIREITGAEYDVLLTNKFNFQKDGSFKIDFIKINPLYLSLIKDSNDESFNKLKSESQKLDYFNKDLSLRRKLIQKIKEYVNEQSNESDVEKN